VGALDNAWDPGILARLWKLNCPPNIYNTVSDFLSNHAAHDTVGNSFSSKRDAKGCPQGSVSGPTLWNIIIDLIALLSNAPNLKIAVFANNVIQGPSLPAIFTTLQNALQIIEDWCKEHRLEISKDKLALMPMFIRNGEYKRHPTIDAWGINIVSKNEIPWNNARLQVGLVSTYTVPSKQVTVSSK
jgi:hypothetical protein